MFKKLIAVVLVLQGCRVYAGSVAENFDWGPGVPGREAFAAGTPVNGVLAQSGNAVFQEYANDHSVFSGAKGVGRGALLMKGLNNSVGFNYPVSGVTVVKAEGRLYPGDGQVRGFWIGCQSAAADNQLLNNQTTDRLAVQLNSSGAIIFRAVVGGVTNQAVGPDGPITFTPGDLVKMELTIDVMQKTANVKVTGVGEGNVKIRTVKWPAGKVPDWGMIIINQTGGGILLLESVEAVADTSVVG
ncbi:MAG: hypothetical protein WC334_09160 [Kiritimatiellales bacterium]|jgi:hypothetical protein